MSENTVGTNEAGSAGNAQGQQEEPTPTPSQNTQAQWDAAYGDDLPPPLDDIFSANSEYLEIDENGDLKLKEGVTLSDITDHILAKASSPEALKAVFQHLGENDGDGFGNVLNALGSEIASANLDSDNSGGITITINGEQIELSSNFQETAQLYALVGQHTEVNMDNGWYRLNNAMEHDPNAQAEMADFLADLHAADPEDNSAALIARNLTFYSTSANKLEFASLIYKASPELFTAMLNETNPQQHGSWLIEVASGQENPAGFIAQIVIDLGYDNNDFATVMNALYEGDPALAQNVLLELLTSTDSSGAPAIPAAAISTWVNNITSEETLKSAVNTLMEYKQTDEARYTDILSGIDSDRLSYIIENGIGSEEFHNDALTAIGSPTDLPTDLTDTEAVLTFLATAHESKIQEFLDGLSESDLQLLTRSGTEDNPSIYDQLTPELRGHIAHSVAHSESFSPEFLHSLVANDDIHSDFAARLLTYPGQLFPDSEDQGQSIKNLLLSDAISDDRRSDILDSLKNVPAGTDIITTLHSVTDENDPFQQELELAYYAGSLTEAEQAIANEITNGADINDLMAENPDANFAKILASLPPSKTAESLASIDDPTIAGSLLTTLISDFNLIGNEVAIELYNNNETDILLIAAQDTGARSGMTNLFTHIYSEDGQGALLTLFNASTTVEHTQDESGESEEIEIGMPPSFVANWLANSELEPDQAIEFINGLDGDLQSNTLSALANSHEGYATSLLPTLREQGSSYSTELALKIDGVYLPPRSELDDEARAERDNLVEQAKENPYAFAEEHGTTLLTAILLQLPPSELEAHLEGMKDNPTMFSDVMAMLFNTSPNAMPEIMSEFSSLNEFLSMELPSEDTPSWSADHRAMVFDVLYQKDPDNALNVLNSIMGSHDNPSELGLAIMDSSSFPVELGIAYIDTLTEDQQIPFLLALVQDTPGYDNLDYTAADIASSYNGIAGHLIQHIYSKEPDGESESGSSIMNRLYEATKEGSSDPRGAEALLLIGEGTISPSYWENGIIQGPDSTRLEDRLIPDFINNTTATVLAVKDHYRDDSWANILMKVPPETAVEILKQLDPIAAGAALLTLSGVMPARADILVEQLTNIPEGATAEEVSDAETIQFMYTEGRKIIDAEPAEGQLQQEAQLEAYKALVASFESEGHSKEDSQKYAAAIFSALPGNVAIRILWEASGNPTEENLDLLNGIVTHINPVEMAYILEQQSQLTVTPEGEEETVNVSEHVLKTIEENTTSDAATANAQNIRYYTVSLSAGVQNPISDDPTVAFISIKDLLASGKYDEAVLQLNHLPPDVAASVLEGLLTEGHVDLVKDLYGSLEFSTQFFVGVELKALDLGAIAEPEGWDAEANGPWVAPSFELFTENMPEKTRNLLVDIIGEHTPETVYDLSTFEQQNALYEFHKIDPKISATIILKNIENDNFDDVSQLLQLAIFIGDTDFIADIMQSLPSHLAAETLFHFKNIYSDDSENQLADDAYGSYYTFIVDALKERDPELGSEIEARVYEENFEPDLSGESELDAYVESLLSQTDAGAITASLIALLTQSEGVSGVSVHSDKRDAVIKVLSELDPELAADVITQMSDIEAGDDAPSLEASVPELLAELPRDQLMRIAVYADDSHPVFAELTDEERTLVAEAKNLGNAPSEAALNIAKPEDAARFFETSPQAALIFESSEIDNEQKAAILLAMDEEKAVELFTNTTYATPSDTYVNQFLILAAMASSGEEGSYLRTSVLANATGNEALMPAVNDFLVLSDLRRPEDSPTFTQADSQTQILFLMALGPEAALDIITKSDSGASLLTGLMQQVSALHQQGDTDSEFHQFAADLINLSADLSDDEFMPFARVLTPQMEFLFSDATDSTGAPVNTAVFDRAQSMVSGSIAQQNAEAFANGATALLYEQAIAWGIENGYVDEETGIWIEEGLKANDPPPGYTLPDGSPLANGTIALSQEDVDQLVKQIYNPSGDPNGPNSLDDLSSEQQIALHSVLGGGISLPIEVANGSEEDPLSFTYQLEITIDGEPILETGSLANGEASDIYNLFYPSETRDPAAVQDYIMNTYPSLSDADKQAFLNELKSIPLHSAKEILEGVDPATLGIIANELITTSSPELVYAIIDLIPPENMATFVDQIDDENLQIIIDNMELASLDLDPLSAVLFMGEAMADAPIEITQGAIDSLNTAFELLGEIQPSSEAFEQLNQMVASLTQSPEGQEFFEYMLGDSLQFANFLTDTLSDSALSTESNFTAINQFFNNLDADSAHALLNNISLGDESLGEILTNISPEAASNFITVIATSDDPDAHSNAISLLNGMIEADIDATNAVIAAMDPNALAAIQSTALDTITENGNIKRDATDNSLVEATRVAGLTLLYTDPDHEQLHEIFYVLFVDPTGDDRITTYGDADAKTNMELGLHAYSERPALLYDESGDLAVTLSDFPSAFDESAWNILLEIMNDPETADGATEDLLNIIEHIDGRQDMQFFLFGDQKVLDQEMDQFESFIDSLKDTSSISLPEGLSEIRLELANVLESHKPSR